MSFEKPTKLRGDLLYLQETGGDPDAVLEGSGYSFAQIAALTPVPTDKMADLLDRLAIGTAQDFGVQCGLTTHFPNMGMLGYRLVNCDTVREVLETWTRYSIIIGYPLASQLKLTKERWTFSFRPRYPLSPAAFRFCMETSLIGPSRSLRDISGHDVLSLAYDFPFPQPDDLSCYAPLAPATLRFGAKAGSVSGRRSDMDLKLVATNPEAKAFCEAYCQQELLRLSTQASVVDRVKEIIVDAVGQFPSAADAAIKLGTSERSLHRKLAAEGRSYLSLVQEFREERALVLLDHKVSPKNAAFMLGYGDEGSFRRAFKRWTGVSPARWRRDHIDLDAQQKSYDS